MASRRLADAARELIAGAAAATLLISAASTRAAAQTQSQVAILGGVDTDQRGLRSSAVTFAPSVAWTNSRGTRLSLGGSATRYTSDAFSLGAGVSVFEHDQFTTPLALELAGSGNVSRLDAANTSATFTSADLTPSLQLGLGAFAAFVGARLAAGRISQSASRPLVPKKNQSGAVTETQSSTGVGPSFGVEYTTLVFPGKSVRVGLREDRLSVHRVNIDDRTATVSIIGGITQFTIAAGRHDVGDEHENFGDIGLQIAVGTSAAFSTSGGWYPTDPLTGALGGNYVNAGFTVRFGNAQHPGAPGPRARGASTPPGDAH